jgi:Tfp pilus assembly protein PilF
MRIRCTTYSALLSTAMFVFGQTAPTPTRAASTKSPGLSTALVYLNGGDAEHARTICEAILTAEPGNNDARACLTQALAQLAARDIAQQTRTLEHAEALLKLGKNADAIAAIDAIQGTYRTPELQQRAQQLLQRATARSFWGAIGQFLAELRQFLTDNGIAWTLDVVIGGLIIAGTYWSLKLVRFAKRIQKASRAKYLGIKKQWRVTPLEDDAKLGISAHVLSAYQTLAPQLQESYNPIVLFLAGAGADQATQRVLTIENNADIHTLRQAALNATQEQSRWRKIARVLGGQPPARPEGFLDLKQQQFEFTDALKELAVKVGGVDVSAIGKFFAAIGKWFDVGIPTISGSAVTYNGTIVIALTQADITTYTTVVATSKDNTFGSIVDTANSAVYKMLYMLGHENSQLNDADAAATIHAAIPALRKHLTGDDKEPDDELATLCQTFSDARRSLSDSAPAYLQDRVRLWEAAARFQHGQPQDLQRAVDLVADLANSEHRAECYHDTYNLAILQERLGDFEAAHGYYTKLASIHETWSPLVMYGKIALLTNPSYQRRWSSVADDVHRWKMELFEGLTSAPPKVTDKVARQIANLRPPQIAVWRAILAATLDCPEPARPTTTIPDQEILTAARAFLEKNISQDAPVDASLLLARIALYTHDFAAAKTYSEQARRRLPDTDATLIATSIYVRAEATYSDSTIDATKRAVLAIELLKDVPDDAYSLIPELRAAIRGQETATKVPGAQG